MKKYILLPFFIFLVFINIEKIFAQETTNKSIIHMKDKTKLIGVVSKQTDSTYKVGISANQYLLINKTQFDSISNYVEKKGNYKNAAEKPLGCILVAQFGKGSLNEGSSNLTNQDIQTVSFGIGLLAERSAAFSLLCSFETLDKAYFVIYPDLKFFLGDSKHIVRGLFEINYFDNKFFGLNRAGNSLNIMGGLALGTYDISVLLAPSFEFINGNKFIKMNVGLSITP
jgi:hypothetical protein